MEARRVTDRLQPQMRTGPRYRPISTPIHFVTTLRRMEPHPNHKTIAQTAQATTTVAGTHKLKAEFPKNTAFDKSIGKTNQSVDAGGN
jgi:hypothetical protein